MARASPLNCPTTYNLLKINQKLFLNNSYLQVMGPWSTWRKTKKRGSCPHKTFTRHRSRKCIKEGNQFSPKKCSDISKEQEDQVFNCLHIKRIIIFVGKHSGAGSSGEISMKIIRSDGVYCYTKELHSGPYAGTWHFCVKTHT